MTRSSEQLPRILHILPIIGFAGAEQMAANLLIPLSRSYEVGAVGLYSAVASPPETSMREAGIPMWFLDKSTGFDPRMFGRLHRVLRDFQPDIVHSHLSVLRYLLPSVMWRHSAIAVHTVHNLAERETDPAGRVVHRIAFKRVVVPVAVSRAVARSVRSFYGGAEPVTIPNGVPVASFGSDPAARARWRRAQSFDEDAFLFIATGRLEAQKNPFLLLRAFAELDETNCHLLFVGDGILRARLNEQIQLLGLESRVHLLGRRSDIRECLAAADAFVMSSDWEGNPLGLMEAMACGLPSVATAVGGVPELVEDRRHGLLVTPGDSRGLTEAMRSVVYSAALRRSMAHAARRRARQEFRLERMVDAYDRLYRLLLERSQVRRASMAVAG